jgi:SAM-dependent methyltransferase
MHDPLKKCEGLVKIYGMSKLGVLYDRFLLLLQPPRIELLAQYERLLANCATLYDVGCGAGNHLDNLNFKPKGAWIGIDSHQGSLEIAAGKGVYSNLVCADILTFLHNCPDSSVDTVLASCVIEHMPKEVGFRLIDEMKRVCRVSAIVFTPNGYVPQPPGKDNPANEHISGWSTNDFIANQFEIDSGLYGFKKLRTSFGLPSIKPIIVGDLIAKSTSRLAFLFPKSAYQVVAVYKKDMT